MRAAAYLVGLVSTVLASSAAADDTKLRRVHIEVRGTTARLTLGLSVRLQMAGRHQLEIEHGGSTVVTGGSVTDAAGKHPMVLTRAVAAQEAFNALADAPANNRAMGSMIVLAAPAMGPLSIEVLSPRAGNLAVELELETTACFDADMRYVAIPDSWTAALTPALRRRVVPAARAEAVAARCDADVEHVRWIGFPATELARRAPGEPRIGVTVARFSDGNQQAARVELAIANTLAEIPHDLHTAIVLDTSVSVTYQQEAAARALVRSYLVRAPHASVQLIGFARTATPLLANWTSAATLSRTIGKLFEQIHARNGSELQPALREAGDWVSRIEGTRRVVLLTDERVADRVAKLSAATLAKELPPGTLVHVIALATRGEKLTRDDTVRWAALAASSEGMSMRCGPDEADTLDALPLVRPISLDHVRITAPGWKVLAGNESRCVSGAAPLALDEGRACTWWGTGSSTADTIDVEGMLWGRRWQRTVPLGDPNNVELARQLQFVLDAAEPLAIAALDAAKAVNSHWSLVARWGGPGGYADGFGLGLTGSGSGCGCGEPSTMGFGRSSGYGFINRGTLRDQLAKAVAGCSRADVEIALRVETTLDEIVDVEAKATVRGNERVPADGGGIETCVQEAVWNTLIHLTSRLEHETANLTY